MNYKNFSEFFRQVGASLEAWRGHIHFLAKIKIEYFCKFILHQITYDLEKFSKKNVPCIFSPPDRRDRATPIFGFDFN